MKALTIRQPWASLIACGVKTIETRSWSTRYRGPLAIHAAAQKPSPYTRLGDYRIRTIGRTGWALEGPGLPEFQSTPRLQAYQLPRGAVVATADLIDVVPVGEASWMCHVEGVTVDCDGWEIHSVTGERFLCDAQLPFGDFAPGRFAWLLDNVQALDVPIPAKGRQGLWTWVLEGEDG